MKAKDGLIPKHCLKQFEWKRPLTGGEKQSHICYYEWFSLHIKYAGKWIQAAVKAG